MSRLARSLSAFLVVACSSGDDRGPTSPPAPVTTGTIRLRATTSGQDVDLDGYFVRVDDRSPPLRLGPNGSITLDGVSVGAHTIVLHDVAPNCTAERDTLAVAIAAPGEAVSADVRVACSALGTMQATVITTGTDVDVSGYRVVTSGVEFVEFADVYAPANGTVLVSRLAPGRHVVSLRDLAANCDLGPEPAIRDVDVVSGATVAVTFFVSCAPATWLAYVDAVTTANSEIYAVRSNGTSTTRLTDHPARDEDPAWSPDGTRIAFTSDRDGRRAIHVMNQDGSNVVRLTSVTSASYRPAWSPDGNRFAFVSERDGNAELYVMNADGTGQTRLTNDPFADRDPAWSPDGTRIAFSSDRDGDAEVYVMNVDGSGLARLTSNDLWDGQPAWSPRGDRLAYARTVCPGGYWPGCYQAVMVATASGSAAVEVGIGEDPAWSAEGLRIAVTGFTCDYYFYYSASPCTVSGIGMRAPIAADGYGYADRWEPVVTTGAHANPTWRP